MKVSIYLVGDSISWIQSQSIYFFCIAVEENDLTQQSRDKKETILPRLPMPTQKWPAYYYGTDNSPVLGAESVSSGN